MRVVLVDIKVAKGRMTEFMALIKAQARNSLARERACLQFDICLSEEDPASVLLYEVYGSAKAFEDHLKTEYFQEFDAVSAPLIAWKSLRFLDRVPQGD